MDAYIFQAALLCEECADHVKAFSDETPSEDSDRWPQGPYPNGGGEADGPQHCDHCGLFLENPLTTDGMEYVRNRVTAAWEAGRHDLSPEPFGRHTTESV